MKKFLFQGIVFLLILFASFYWVFDRANGRTDPYYRKFTTPTQSSFILGISKAAQGLRPEVFNKILNRNDFFNYAFTISSSPYGKVYLESIKKKLDPSTKNGIFILTVDAWSICSNTEDPSDLKNFSEVGWFLDMHYVSMNPNIEYLYKFYDAKFIQILLENQTSFYLHKDGWLEVEVPLDSLSIKNRIDRNIDYYTENYIPRWKFSSTRLEYLYKTVEYLKNYGKVYLVRLPVHPRVLELEKMLMSDVDAKINLLSHEENVDYLNLLNQSDKFIYTDGFHLSQRSGLEVSKIVAKWINNKNKDY